MLLLAIILLSVRLIVKENGRFSSQHVAENEAMKRAGITCANSQDRKAQYPDSRKLNVNEL